jgi:iron complex outermembrane recepter protein
LTLEVRTLKKALRCKDINVAPQYKILEKRMYRMTTYVVRSLLLSTATLAFMPATFAQQAPAAQTGGLEDIIVTATKRATPLQDVPIAVSAITSAQLKNSGITDIRELTSVAPSLILTSSASEAAGTVARIRGIGTVGDNQGLESSVAVFIDGVYRSRNNVGLTELGEVERIEVLRGPQGTLFGRNASAGLINVITKGPKQAFGGYAEATYGNYNFMRFAAGVTGGLGGGLAARLDGNYSARDGYLKDSVTGQDYNDRNRWLLRGQLGYEADALSVRFIADYSERRENCCAAVTIVRGPTGNIIEGLGGRLASGGTPVGSSPYDRISATTPGRGYQQDVDEWGFSGEINYDFGGAKLTSITAYRDWKANRSQDSDFSSADILYRDRNGLFSEFKNFSQEFRFNGSALGDKLDYLFGAYYANEKLSTRDALKYGANFQNYANLLVGGSPTVGFQNLNLFIAGATQARLVAAGVPAAAAAAQAGLLAAIVQPAPLAAGTGAALDAFNQTSNNWALFTHNTFSITEGLKLTVGVRYTEEKKTLNGSLASNNAGCTGVLNSITAINANTNPALIAPSRAIAVGTLNAIRGLPCVINPQLDGTVNSSRKEKEWSGTAVLSYKFEDVLGYLSYSKGYKAGGFNLDRAGLNSTLNSFGIATTTDPVIRGSRLQFEPEKVNAYELGAKFASRLFTLNAALFYQDFKGFQLNAFDGLAFTVTNVAKVTSKGVEVDFLAQPVVGLTTTLGLAIADTKYGKDLIGPSFVQPTATSPAGANFQLPGARLTNAPLYSISGSIGYRHPVAGSSLVAGIYTDFRYTSDINSGSDLDPEKNQDGGIVVNARASIGQEDSHWSLEVYARNVFNRNYTQIAFDSPGQGGGTRGNPFSGQGGNPANTQSYSAFLAEPRTFGVTARYKF